MILPNRLGRLFRAPETFHRRLDRALPWAPRRPPRRVLNSAVPSAPSLPPRFRVKPRTCVLLQCLRACHSGTRGFLPSPAVQPDPNQQESPEHQELNMAQLEG